MNEIEAYLKNTAQQKKYQINEKRLPTLIERFTKQKEKYGKLYCPCQNLQNEDTVCPCKYMLVHQVCRCGLYTKKEN